MDKQQIALSPEDIKDINIVRREMQLTLDKYNALCQMEIYKLFAMRGLKITDWTLNFQEDGGALLIEKVPDDAS